MLIFSNKRKGLINQHLYFRNVQDYSVNPYEESFNIYLIREQDCDMVLFAPVLHYFIQSESSVGS